MDGAAAERMSPSDSSDSIEFDAPPPANRADRDSSPRKTRSSRSARTPRLRLSRADDASDPAAAVDYDAGANAAPSQSDAARANESAPAMTGEPATTDAASGAPLSGDASNDASSARSDGGTESDAAHMPVEQSLSAVQIIEALLFSTDAPLPPAKIVKVLGVGDVREVRRHIAALNERYTNIGAAFRIHEIAGGYQVCTLPVFHSWVARLNKTRQETRLSPAALETLAIVAYKQPVTRADIEAVRGVSSGDLLNRLREVDLVRIVGRAEDLGRPMLYGTTRRFLEVFGLASLDELPRVEGPMMISPPRQQAAEQPVCDAESPSESVAAPQAETISPSAEAAPFEAPRDDSQA